METLFLILASTVFISLGALVGIFTLAVKEKTLAKVLMVLVSFSAGAMMGGAFLHLLPEAAENLEPPVLFGVVLAAFITFFFIEKLFHWRHCHQGNCDVHTFGYMNLVGDTIHNFLDGLILAATFLTDIRLGVITTLAVAFHEIPQEIGDFGVLLYAGFAKKKALIANFLVALTVVLGGVAGYFLSQTAAGVIPYLLPMAAGGFIYIAASDLMPEIRKEESLAKSLVYFGGFLAGIGLMLLVKFLGGE
jgi:zinc and cadmium transporter